jgi:hypothetical protein
MTKAEYLAYEKAVQSFFEREGVNNLSFVSEEEGLCEPFFSWRRCDCCGTHLGGDRYHCNGYNPTTKEVQEYDCVCGDCVYYAEYGRLDDMTMMEVEK